MDAKPQFISDTLSLTNVKNCTKCGELKLLSEFHRNKNKKDGYKSECKACISKQSKMRYAADPEKMREKTRRYRVKHLEKCKECVRQWRAANPERAREDIRRWYAANSEKVKESARRWQAANPGKHREFDRRYRAKNPEKARTSWRRANKKHRSTAKGKLSCAMSTSTWRSLNDNKAGKHWETLVGYTVDDLKKHLQRKFPSGMSWDNYGKWQIDHRIPISVFNFENPKDLDFRRCWDLKNLQPMWKIDNIKKSNKLDRPFQPSFAFTI